jgi:hypothetical protein
MECTLAMREVDIAMGWKLVDSPQVNPLNNPACLLHWRVLLTTLQWLDRTRQEAVREDTPVLSDSICRYVPSPVPVVQEVPTCVVEEPEDWMKDYPDTPSQPFQLREFKFIYNCSTTIIFLSPPCGSFTIPKLFIINLKRNRRKPNMHRV